MLKKEAMSFKLLMLFMFALILLVTHSHIIIGLSTLFVIILLITEKVSVKLCITNIKKYILWLIFIILFYIILIGGVLNTLWFIYKLLLILILINIIFHDINYFEINRGINTILSPLKLKKCNFSYNAMLSLYFMNSYKHSKETLKKEYKEIIKIPKGLKLITALDETEEYDKTLQNRFYDKTKKDTLTLKNKIILILFLIVLIVVLIRK